MNGARTGMGITPPAQRVILSVLRVVPAASGAVVPGAAPGPNLRSAMPSTSTPGNRYYTLGFRLSLRPASKQVAE